MSFVRVYVRKGKVFLPNVIQRPEGIFVDSAPVEVIGLNDREAVEQALTEALHKDNEIVASLEDAEGPGSVILDAVGIRRWEAFERAAVLYTVHVAAGGTMVYVTGRGADGMWQRNKDNERLFTGADAEHEVVSFIVNDMLARKELSEPEPTLPMLLPPPLDKMD